MSDVAAAVGVSKITVSRALRGSELVKPAVRERIQAKASELGYRMNLAARDLRLRQRMRIAVVVDMPASDERPFYDPFPLALLGGIMHECAAAGFAAVLTTNDPRMRAEVQDTCGIIVLGRGAHDEAVRSLSSFNLPLVVWGAGDGLESDRAAAIVGSDNRFGGRLAADYLIGRGRSHLVFLGNTDHAEVSERATGFGERLRESGLAPAAARNCDFTTESGYTAMTEILVADSRIDGVFAGSDLVAIGAMQALSDAKKGPGINVSVVGYDDIPAAAANTPRLTTLRQDWTRAGRLLAEALLAQLAAQSGSRAVRHFLPVELVIRDT